VLRAHAATLQGAALQESAFRLITYGLVRHTVPTYDGDGTIKPKKKA
jgi:hypothetical protein